MEKEDLRHAIVAVVDEGLVGPGTYCRRPGAARRGGPSVNRLGFAPAGIQTGEGEDARAQTGRRNARALCSSVPRAFTLAGVVRGRTRGAWCGRGSCAHEDGRDPFAASARRSKP